MFSPDNLFNQMQGKGNSPFDMQQQFGNAPPQSHQNQFQQPPQQQQGFPSSSQNPMMGGAGFGFGFDSGQQQQQQQFTGGFGQQSQPSNPMGFPEQQGGFNQQQNNNFGQQPSQGIHSQHQQGPMMMQHQNNGHQMGSHGQGPNNHNHSSNQMGSHGQGQFQQQQQQQSGFQQSYSGGGFDLKDYKDLHLSFISNSMRDGIKRGEYIQSAINNFYCSLTKSGELICFKKSPSNVYWNAGVKGGDKAIVDDKGNLKVVDQSGNTLWQIDSNIDRAIKKTFTLKNDGSLELKCDRTVVWTTQPGPKN